MRFAGTETRRAVGRPSMPLRVLALVLAPALIASVAVLPTAGWANGPNGDGYGTHDWVLDQAFKLVESDADWFDREAALLVTDDPDYLESDVDPYYTIEHVYRDEGKYGGAIHQITEHYAKAVRLYDEGKYTAASKEIGLLSHFWSDIMQPYHTNYDGVGKDTSHRAYELLVDDVTDTPSDSSSWSCADCTTRTLLSNVRTSAVAAAAYSRGKFPSLYSEFSKNTSVLNTAVKDITRLLMRRTVKDLADVIYSIQRGKGVAPAVGSVSVRTRWQGVKSGETKQGVFATAKDVNGDPMPGLQIDIAWPEASGGTTPLRLFVPPTGGEAGMVVPKTTHPKMKKQTVTASATTDGKTATKTTWFYVTPKLADGTAGFRTRVNDSTVKAGQTIKVGTYAKDTSGNPVAGLLVTWTFDYNGKKIVATGYTDSNGRAGTTRTIVSATTRKKIHVQASTQAYSVNRYSNAYFWRVD